VRPVQEKRINIIQARLMDYGNLNTFAIAQQKMRYLGARQAAIAQNIANADTPDYIPRDIKRPDFSKDLAAQNGALSLSVTHSSHMQPKNGSASGLKPIHPRYTFETNPNGNKVAIDEEVQKMAFNQSEYQQTTLIYRKTVEMLRTAIGRTGGA
jgi:flagellar basal-body rod protein FlgB